MSVFKEILATTKLGFPVTVGNVTMYPMESYYKDERNFLDFKEEVIKGTVKVTELDSGASVNAVKVINTNKEAVLLLDGTHLEGAMQERTVNLSILIPSTSELEIPVSCVEAGRWRPESKAFYTEGRLHFNRGRRGRHKSVSEFLARGRNRNSDQNEVWDSISAKEAAMKTHSRTQSMGNIYETNKDIVEQISASINAVPNQNGALFAINRRVIGFDLFFNENTLKSNLKQLTESVAIDAIELSYQRVIPSRTSVKDFLNYFNKLKEVRYPGVGLGEDIRAYDERVSASALIHSNDLVHMSGFVLDASERGSSYRRDKHEAMFKDAS